MKPVILFLSTPRCGTQWFAKHLDQVYSEEVTALHEPIDNDYYPKLNLGRYDLPLQPSENDKLEKHLDFIEAESKTKKYIEIGWQNIAGVQAMYQRFGNRLKFIHLYRNPVYVAASLVTHNWYSGIDEDRFKKVGIDPYDETSIKFEDVDRWIDLTLFEKSLFFWTEINMRAIEINHRFAGVPFHSLKFEDVFKKDKETSRITLIETLAFMGLEYNEELIQALDFKHDKYRYKTHDKLNWKAINSHPQTMALAKKLGYELDRNIDLSRYRGFSLLNKLDRNLKSYFKRLSQFYVNSIYSISTLEFIDFNFLYFISAV